MNSGSHDPVSDDEHQLDNILKDGSHINKYIIKFNYLTTQAHGKDEITHIGKPACLTELCTVAQGIDMCYWRCRSEIACQIKLTLSPLSHSSSLAAPPIFPPPLAKARTCSDYPLHL
ncbi:hypothetical protein ID866_6686 [Astraeus odoratus]|nr:hypothetical protein ID866_6686 [Astraeus odoratus]